jgi:hypothetical protein
MTATTTRDSSVKGPRISTELFGGVLDIDGAGHYPGLELINFVICCKQAVLPGVEVDRVEIIRRSHSFARRLIAQDGQLQEAEWNKVLLDAGTRDAMVKLLRCIELDVPNTVKVKSWERTHFFPYTRSLVHWDARSRDGISYRCERRYLRGGGAFAFSVLRRDPNLARLESIREGFRNLYPVNGFGALETVARALISKGFIDKESVVDQLESQSRVMNDEMDDLYRDGMASILAHERTPHVQRIRAVMNWTGIWLCLLQVRRAVESLPLGGKQQIVMDCAGIHPQLRRASQKCLKQTLLLIEDATRQQAERMNAELPRAQINKIRGFFSGTAALCGLLNSLKGRRHFTLKLSAIETLVMASGQGTERSFEDFTDSWLGDRCGLIVGRQAAAKAGLLNDFDASIFEENERQFADQMRATGMLRVYSDATRMVSAEVGQ